MTQKQLCDKNNDKVNPVVEEVYSTEEIKIGKWIDGKPLYRKVLELITPSSDSVTKIFTIDSNVDIINYYGYIYSKYYNQKMPLNFYFTPTNYISTYIERNEIRMLAKDSLYQKCNAKIFIEYTKTTD